MKRGAARISSSFRGALGIACLHGSKGGGRHPWARAKPLKGDPAMRLLGQEPVRRGRATGGRQGSCAVHDLGASDGESAPWRQDVRAVHSPTALCGAFWTHSTHILPKLAVSEYMKAICCREPVFFSSEAPSGTHRGAILPWPAAWERIGMISCHGRQLGNASGRYLAMARRRMIATEVHRRPISDCNGSKPLTNRADERTASLECGAYSTLFSASIMLILARVRLESCATIKANSSVRPHA